MSRCISGSTGSSDAFGSGRSRRRVQSHSAKRRWRKSERTLTIVLINMQLMVNILRKRYTLQLLLSEAMCNPTVELRALFAWWRGLFIRFTLLLLDAISVWRPASYFSIEHTIISTLLTERRDGLCVRRVVDPMASVGDFSSLYRWCCCNR
jgi:hypothetical protein